MPSIHRILVAIKDPTARTSPALEKAAQLAKTTGAVIELFHAIGEPVALDFELQETSLEEVRQTRKAAVCQRLEKLAQRSRHASGLPIKTAAEWDFPPHEAIVRRAQAIRANLIVADRHPGSARFPWLMRLTDWELLRHSPVPVLLVRNKRPYERAPVLAAVDPSHAHFAARGACLRADAHRCHPVRDPLQRGR
jgi:universal stress protein E